jgi:hypothetical protein
MYAIFLTNKKDEPRETVVKNLYIVFLLQEEE